MPLGGVIFIAVFIFLFGALLLFIAAKLGTAAPKDHVKDESYECGIPVQEKKDTKMSVKFYLTAILFIIFDIEVIFMYPWAVIYKDSVQRGMGGYMLGTMGFFLLIFIFGLFWEIKSKALEWD